MSKANKTGQFNIITTTPDVRTFHNYPTVYDGPPFFHKEGEYPNATTQPHHASSRLSSFRHPGVSGPAKLQNFVGDFGRDPVDDICRQPVSFGIITQVDTAYQLDTALRRYDDSGAWITRYNNTPKRYH